MIRIMTLIFICCFLLHSIVIIKAQDYDYYDYYGGGNSGGGSSGGGSSTVNPSGPTTEPPDGEDSKKVITDLFANYSNIVRPNKNYNYPMLIDLNLYLVGINDLDDVQGKLTTTGYLRMNWTDEYLTWTDVNVKTVYVPQSKVWKPDITLKNGFTKLTELGSDFIQVKIQRKGQIVWSPFEVFSSKCDVDVKFFPFDQQTCKLIFVVWSSSITDVNVTKGVRGFVLDDTETGEWTIISSSAVEEREKSESMVTFTLNLERDPGFYIMNIIVPIVLLGLLNIFTFVIPHDCGEKMSYSMTVFLSFAVFLTIVSAQLPKTSGSYLGYYLMMLLGLGVITVAVTSVELRLHFRTVPVPIWLAKMVNCGCCRKTNIVEDSENNTKRKKVTETTWADVTAAIDFFMFWTILIIFALSTVFFMVVLKARLNIF